MPQPATGPAASGPAAADSTEANQAEANQAEANPAEANPADGARASRAWQSAGRPRLVGLLRSVPAVLRQHWLASALIAVGLVLRVLTQMAYHPAIIYIDSLKYLYGAWAGSDPVGYKIPVKLIIWLGGSTGTVELVQHLLGIAIAIGLYAVLVRRGVPRWLGAVAIAPILLDAYQLQVEAMIMPDVWFEAFVAAGLVVLLWKPAPSLGRLMAAGAILGGSVGMREVGEGLIVPALLYVVVLRGGWRTVLRRMSAVTVAFAIAILTYLSASYQITGHFWVSRSSVSLTYGRMAGVVDCSTLKLPPIERPLCPGPAAEAKGPDWLDHSTHGPLRTYALNLPPTANHDVLVASFNKAVERQQPLRVLSGILHDSVKLFALTRHSSPGDTPISRWQFQTTFPTKGYYPWVMVKNNQILVTLGSLESYTVKTLKPSYGGAPQVDEPIAAFLRSYQLGGGYTPGPLLALCLVIGLIGSALAFSRRRLSRAPAAAGLAVGCLAFFSVGAVLLGVSDVFEFTWRYQLPALVTLPPAGALGITALILARRKSPEPVAADAVATRAPEMATPAT